ncbi:DUF3306 domain-containing protein [Polynucleobacter sp. AP-Kaivos-20-H2]|uniref:DUF3306 domain-containing protein n=1 Tax=Polynucleobacter sp. AP-Kaivos-20-H2 TaxID=2689104 RepID=UPI001C0AB6B5|nr:DUF3306 domain-containing protein [Polynucleobacter sp. AP-Kaivos-20-H2]MBU3603750.1 DUF3306 domain-containing protein [Polynucleobacter sp. AP-Kaivos-20-H2]
MTEGFLGRWSKRKSGKEEVSLEKKLESPKESPQALPVESDSIEAPPPATLDDVAKIDRFDPDFSAFMKPDVDPAVQQAALKKMFTDPHFNIMDGLDIYIDDYSKPDPLPPGMLERMVQSDMLNLFRKTSDEIPQDSQQNAGRVPNPQLDGDTVAAQQQSDLTSTYQIPDPLDEVRKEAPKEEALKEASIQPVHRKTSEDSA